jgi:hypothetical protein
VTEKQKIYQIHRFRYQSARHANIDGSLLSVPSQNPNLDSSHLQRMYRIRYAILEFIFNGSCAKQEKIFLDQFRSLIQSFSTTINSIRSLIVNSNPLFVFFLWNVSECDA